ncbi:MAG TPA: glycosyltransferase family 1 protein [Nanoarchaeota archaeon]|nr:glycosyltransferase family 1 protein [Nanoarchaeota archaeon]
MHIAFFVWEYPPCLVGGLGTYARDVTTYLTKLGHKVSVFTLNPVKKEECTFCERKHMCELSTHEFINGVEVHRPMIIDVSDVLCCISEELKKWGNGIKFFSDVFSYNILSASKLVNKIIFEEKIDIVCVHDWLSAIAGLVIKNDTSLPVVFHVHATEELRANLSNMVKALEHKMAEKADKIITVSYAMKEHLISIGYPYKKIEVVWNGVDAEFFNPKTVKKELVEKWKERHGIKDGEKVVLFIGRLTKIKGVENLILSFSHVLKQFPETKLVIIGKGEEYMHLLELSKKLRIENKVSIVSEFISREDLKANYALADVCVFPSLAEPFGIVCSEAMAMEKPVVVGAKGVSGFREQVIPCGAEQCGVHIDPENPEDIAWGIKVCLENEDRAKKWGKNGRKRVLKNFTIEKTVEKTLKIYESLIE